jgi:hypothetical protein
MPAPESRSAISPKLPAVRIGCTPAKIGEMRYESLSASNMYSSGTPLCPESRCPSDERTSYTAKRTVTTTRKRG